MPNWLNPDLQRLMIALLIGAMVGAEREYRSKSAGLRTMIMVSIGSCVFAILSQQIGYANPDRLAANVVTGIGFLGAGVIFKTDDKVSGITTATAIWVVAALGMAAGFGHILLAIFGTLITILVLVFLIKLQNKIDKLNHSRQYRIVCDYKQETLFHYENIFRQYKLKSQRGKQTKTPTEATGEWMVYGKFKNHEKLIQRLLNDKEIIEFDF
jgi:putative Mg2+ transporter-C (MgtC) family protein